MRSLVVRSECCSSAPFEVKDVSSLDLDERGRYLCLMAGSRLMREGKEMGCLREDFGPCTGLLALGDDGYGGDSEMVALAAFQKGALVRMEVAKEEDQEGKKIFLMEEVSGHKQIY